MCCFSAASRKIVGKLRENCGAAAKPPEASRSNASAQGTHRAPNNRATRTNKEHVRNNCRKLQNRDKIAKNSGTIADLKPPPPPTGVSMLPRPLVRPSQTLSLTSTHCLKAPMWTLGGPPTPSAPSESFGLKRGLNDPLECPGPRRRESHKRGRGPVRLPSGIPASPSP